MLWRESSPTQKLQCQDILNSMKQQTPWKYSLSSGQEIPSFEASFDINYRIHRTPPSDSVLSQLEPLYTLVPYFCIAHCNIMFPSKPKASKQPLSFIYVLISHIPIRTTCLTHLIFLTLITLILDEKYKLYSSTFCPRITSVCINRQNWISHTK